MPQSNNPESENAFLSKAQLIEELKAYEIAKGTYDLGEEERRTLAEVRTYLRAGSEILELRLGTRESEAAEYFMKGLAVLAQAKTRLPHAIKEIDRAREAEDRAKEAEAAKRAQRHIRAVAKYEEGKRKEEKLERIALAVGGIIGFFGGMVCGIWLTDDMTCSDFLFISESTVREILCAAFSLAFGIPIGFGAYIASEYLLGKIFKK